MGISSHSPCISAPRASESVQILPTLVSVLCWGTFQDGHPLSGKEKMRCRVLSTPVTASKGKAVNRCLIPFEAPAPKPALETQGHDANFTWWGDNGQASHWPLKAILKSNNRASLVVQWLRIHLPMQGTLEPWSRKIPHAMEQLSPRATTTEPTRLEPVLRNKRSHHNKKPVHRNEE